MRDKIIWRSTLLTFINKLFGQPDVSSIALNIQGAVEIDPQKAVGLVEPFSMEEIHSVVFSLEKIKALVLMVFLLIFISIFGM